MVKGNILNAVFISFILYLWNFATPLACVAAEMANRPENLFTFAESLFGEGDYFRAITEYKRVIFYFPQDKVAESCRFRIGESYYQAKRWVEAVDAFDNFIKEYPRSLQTPQARYLKALAEKELKRFSDARKSFDDLIKSENSDLADKAAYQKAMILIEQEEWTKAKETLHLVPRSSSLYGNSQKLVLGLERMDTLSDKSPGVAGTLAAIIPGSGHLYAERPKDAAVAFLLNASFIAAAVELFRKDNIILGSIVTFAEVGWYLGNIYSAVNSAHKYNAKQKKDFLQRLKDETFISFYYNPYNTSEKLLVSIRF